MAKKANPLTSSLDEAIQFGRGTERPFRCINPDHDDKMASASVNVLKGVWFCHACQASGKVDDTKAPKVEDLQAMLEPELAARIYSESWLELFTQPGPKYWDERFAPWVSHMLRMGQDPFTSDATFPVHTPAGQIAGVGRRHIDPESKQKRYLYPRRWSASVSLGGTNGRYPALPIICAVEGMADAASVWETGCPALAVYGSGFHLPQVELLARFNPKLILLGFDMDDAGEKAVTRGFKQIGRIAPVKRVYWPKDDPAASPWGGRRAAIAKAVSQANYGVNVIPAWDRFISEQKRVYQRHLEEAA
jgi:hypothetical protein